MHDSSAAFDGDAQDSLPVYGSRAVDAATGAHKMSPGQVRRSAVLRLGQSQYGHKCPTTPLRTWTDVALIDYLLERVTFRVSIKLPVVTRKLVPATEVNRRTKRVGRTIT